MTLIISWIGVDQKKEGKSIASIYLASDSRYRWAVGNGKYDYGVKVFGSTRHPEIFGFFGDVLFPFVVLGQMIPQIDAGLVIDEADDGETKNKKIFDFIKSSFASYPEKYLTEPFTILHGTRIMNNFRCYKISYFKRYGLVCEELRLPEYSSTVFTGGSGKDEFDTNWLKWTRTHNNFGTSRAVYHCLDKTLKETKDPSVGGLPQIVGLYRVGNARIFGIIENERKYVYGKESSIDINSKSIEWRNGNFERMNPETLKLFDSAQRQPS